MSSSSLGMFLLVDNEMTKIPPHATGVADLIAPIGICNNPDLLIVQVAQRRQSKAKSVSVATSYVPWHVGVHGSAGDCAAGVPF
ncbi:hypothetical protein Vi05172_g10599 [Venturia inaequalis]|nr:hypothetical protein Vi05172_g10599 [Venturia inaequalis]